MTDKVTIPALLQTKRDGRKSVGVVAWDYQIARIADRAGVDIVSVGDSVGKFALRGLAQSMARELSPQGIHVAHVVIDGGIKSARRAETADNPDSLLDPDAIAESYMHLIHQPRSAWAWEIELRPWVEKF